jgi:Flp pilus assembly pilin Flp
MPLALFALETDEDGMNRITKTLSGLITDENGGEVIEYAIVLGLIVVTAIVIIANVGTKVLARWGSVNSSM